VEPLTTSVRAGRRSAIWVWSALAVVTIATLWSVWRPAVDPASAPTGPIAIDVVPVPLNPDDPAATALGSFQYAGGLVLSGRQTNLLHELSDLIIAGEDRLTAIGDEGIVFDARLEFDTRGWLTGVADATVTHLVVENGEDGANGAGLITVNKDAEGLTVLPGGDRLVSFEKAQRILLYPAAGGPPREVPSPQVRFPSNAGMEALTADPDAGPDVYLVGAEASGETWRCQIGGSCIQGPTVDKPDDFALVAMHWMPGGMIAYLLRAYDPVQGSRVSLEIMRGTTVIDRMDMAPPMTVDNFEGLASVPRPDGRHRFYLLSDDNNQASQRTLLLAFDWQPPPAASANPSYLGAGK
jgi:hypothetical protein